MRGVTNRVHGIIHDLKVINRATGRRGYLIGQLAHQAAQLVEGLIECINRRCAVGEIDIRLKLSHDTANVLASVDLAAVGTAGHNTVLAAHNAAGIISYVLISNLGSVLTVFDQSGGFTRDTARVGRCLVAVCIDGALVDATRNRTITASGNAARVGRAGHRHTADAVANHTALFVDTDQTADALITGHSTLSGARANGTLVASGKQSQTGLGALGFDRTRQGQAGNRRTRLDVSEQAAVRTLTQAVISGNRVVTAVKRTAEHWNRNRTIAREVNVAIEHNGKSLTAHFCANSLNSLPLEMCRVFASAAQAENPGASGISATSTPIPSADRRFTYCFICLSPPPCGIPGPPGLS